MEIRKTITINEYLKDILGMEKHFRSQMDVLLTDVYRVRRKVKQIEGIKLYLFAKYKDRSKPVDIDELMKDLGDNCPEGCKFHNCRATIVP